ncbi:mannosyltransferase [Dictyobacter alpinus]|uniref:Mannosyltransferase n=1 Tax=Dictyobacter alpinus TaxID=2014873 RepID=A0A402BC19_9CHLR|nr:glycosyltransferase family 39 protein [Dictyobacter alpinus]GCE28842.1 mannosyltransferase [Dictyobacter alpinus]
MADIVDVATTPTIEQNPPERDMVISRLWQRIALGAVLLLAVFMDFFQLGQNGYGNAYYAAGVRSMTDSWHNFFFVSFDPGGFVTVDKPPLGFWLQTLSAKIFGFTPFSIFLPQALCGVLAVWLLYRLVTRHFGPVAGLLAGLALAVTPISVVTNRNNTIDGTLALVLLLAAWAVIHAAESGKLRWLLLSAVFVGLGFNVKMAEAYLVVPALGLTYLLCAPRKVWTRVWHLLLALLVMFVLSLSWALAVDLTPASMRPYVGSTQDNSELSLAFGYNGLNRLRFGGNGFGGGGGRTRPENANPTTPPQSRTTASQAPVSYRSTAAPTPTPTATNRQFPGGGQFPRGNGAGRQFAAGPGGMQNGGAGPLRLLGVTLGGQIGWLLPFALIALIALLVQQRFRFQGNKRQIALVLWGMWLLTMATFFSVDGSFHQYYMTELSPGIAALVGIGLVGMWRAYRGETWDGWLLPLALALTAVAQIYMLTSYPDWSLWLSPIIGILTALVVIALIVFRARPRLNRFGRVSRLFGSLALPGLLVLLVAPTIWSGYSVLRNVESSSPTAGPTVQTDAIANFPDFPGFPGRTGAAGSTRGGQNAAARAIGGFGGGGNANPALVSYLEQHQGTDKFLLATASSNTADSIIMSTNKPVMALGGFSGGDPILTTTDLQKLISNGTVRYFWLSSASSNTSGRTTTPGQFNPVTAGGFGRQNQDSTWVTSNCQLVPTSAWQTSSSSTGAISQQAGNQLYDCATTKP